MTKTLTSLAALALSVTLATLATGSTAQADGLKLVPTPVLVQVIQLPTPDPQRPIIDDDPPIFKPYDPGFTPIPVFPNLPKKPKGHAEEHELLLDCKIADASGRTDDLWLVNFGDDEIPAATKIRYAVPSTGDHGAFLLPRSIEPGSKVKISDLLNDAKSGAPCRVQILD